MNDRPASVSGPPLRVGLLQCGHVHADLIARHGDYPELFAALLGPHGVELETFNVQLAPPPALDACDAWVISGSADSSYDPLPWIAPMEVFLRAAIDAAAPMVAVCFGHQLLAQAFGGRVERAPTWGAGAHDYRVVRDISGTHLTAGQTVRLIASHQDQVTKLPPGAEVVLSTDHCPHAGYLLGPAALAIQPHPEFTIELSHELSDLRWDRMGHGVTEAALASLDQPIDQAEVGAAMVAFLRAAATTH